MTTGIPIDYYWLCNDARICPYILALDWHSLKVTNKHQIYNFLLTEIVGFFCFNWLTLLHIPTLSIMLTHSIAYFNTYSISYSIFSGLKCLSINVRSDLISLFLFLRIAENILPNTLSCTTCTSSNKSFPS